VTNLKINKLANPILWASTLYFFYLTYVASSWRLDTTHDGYVYISAHLGIYGIYPPQTTNHHGIVAPFLESKLLQLFSPTLLTYRFIGLVLIWLTVLMIYKIISLKTNKLAAGLFSLLWISANPPWSTSIKQIYIHIQPTWPNLWIQLFALISFFLVLRKKFIGPVDQIVVGVLLATIPFIRIQGLAYSILILGLVLYKNKSLITYFLISIITTSFAWISLIQMSGGIGKYFRNIILNPVTLTDYSPWRSINSIFFTFAYRGKYYLVLLLVITVIYLLIPQLNNSKFKTIKLYEKFFLVSILTILILALTAKNQNAWLNSLYGNATFLLIDTAVPLAFVYLAIILRKLANHRDLTLNKENKMLIFFAVVVLISIIYQFPLADNGHKWWSTAASVIFLALLAQDKEYFGVGKYAKISLKHTVTVLSISSILLSTVEGAYFLQARKIQVNDTVVNKFNGITYPPEDSEVISNLLTSLQVLTNLENSKMTINYVCAEGLYYVRKNGNSPQSRKSLDFSTSFSTKYDVNFFCNSSLTKIPELLDYQIISVGDNLKNIFLVDKNNRELIKSIEGWIKS
jgi:hypothetical protein